VNFFTALIRRLDSRQAQLEIEEELQFHLDLLTAEHCRQDMTWDEARATAIESFGNVEQIRDECLKVARRNHPVVVALKWFFGFVFVTGVLVRIFSPEFHLTRVGDILMAVGALSRLLLYLRGMNRASYVSQPDESTLIKLNDSAMSLTAYDRRKRTPVERVISYK
jgi:hypothetical protein